LQRFVDVVAAGWMYGTPSGSNGVKGFVTAGRGAVAGDDERREPSSDKPSAPSDAYRSRFGGSARRGVDCPPPPTVVDGVPPN
jgi:hypothetical protein